MGTKWCVLSLTLLEANHPMHIRRNRARTAAQRRLARCAPTVHHGQYLREHRVHARPESRRYARSAFEMPPDLIGLSAMSYCGGWSSGGRPMKLVHVNSIHAAFVHDVRVPAPIVLGRGNRLESVVQGVCRGRSTSRRR